MIPNHLVDQPLHILKAHGYTFNDMSEEQKKTAIWWDEHYKNAKNLPLQGAMEFRMKSQGYKEVMREFITGSYPVLSK